MYLTFARNPPDERLLSSCLPGDADEQQQEQQLSRQVE